MMIMIFVGIETLVSLLVYETICNEVASSVHLKGAVDSIVIYCWTCNWSDCQIMRWDPGFIAWQSPAWCLGL